MSTVYATIFDNTTKMCTSPSTDSGFTSFMQLVKSMGKPDLQPSHTLLIYGKDNIRVLFSKTKFCIDDPVNKG